MREIIGITCGVVALVSLGIAIGLILSQCFCLRASHRLRAVCQEELDRFRNMRCEAMGEDKSTDPAEPKEPELDYFRDLDGGIHD